MQLLSVINSLQYYILLLHLENKFGLTLRLHLKSLNKEELLRLGRQMGLHNKTVRKLETIDSVKMVREKLIKYWLRRKDEVAYCGGVTWESLDRSLRKAGLHRVADNIQSTTSGGMLFLLCVDEEAAFDHIIL